MNPVTKHCALLVTIMMVTIGDFAPCYAVSSEDAGKVIVNYYESIGQWLAQSSSDASFKKRKLVALLLPGAGDIRKGNFNFPNEPHLIFGSPDASPFLELTNYFNLFDNQRFPIEFDQQQRCKIELKVTYGEVRSINYYSNFADEPNERPVAVEYYEMVVNKAYTVSRLQDDGESTSPTIFRLTDTTTVRKRDGVVAMQRNRCGGYKPLSQGQTTTGDQPGQQPTGHIAQDEVNLEAYLIVALEAWNDKNYTKAYDYYWRALAIKETSRACFHLGLMMYDQWKKRAVFNPNVDRKRAGKWAVNLMKRAIAIGDEPQYVREAYRALYYMKEQD